MTEQTMNPLRAARVASMRQASHTGTRRGLNTRKDFPYSYRKTAHMLKISDRQLERIERGECIPGPRTAERIARCFGFENAQEVRKALRAWRDEYVVKEEAS
jgi:ribosome-binding protein aMBF1 (putative translation factor)